ncbi:MAG: hypothetical protein WC932_05595 [archaeon]|jgi:hypothetical protein
MPTPKPKPRKQIVHLGNVGEDAGYRSKKLAEKHPSFQFHGIDLKDLRDNEFLHPSAKEEAEKNPYLSELRENRLKQEKPANLNQIRADFIEGLNSFPDNYLNLVTSDFSIGFYKEEKDINLLKETITRAGEVGNRVYSGSEEYTKRILDLIYKKLKPKGKVITYYFKRIDNAGDHFSENLLFAFKNSKFKYKIEKVSISEISEELRTFYLLHFGLDKDYSIHRIIAIKE